ncbi:hypothetical protein [Streptomyces sp. ISL-43]|uniref:hypothetical protein n=1 Tax=Streptomyces sp. ISL-43 TaxID=2819183 RepID=UPI0020357075|nr:hypothetical protein [Streptomyces sp. ISL-43]
MAGTERPGGGDQGGTQTGGGQSAGKLTSFVQTTGDKREPGAKSEGFTAEGNWTPPACWYEPRSPEQLKAYIEAVYNETANTPGQLPHAGAAVAQFKQIYEDGEYKNYNLDKAGQGAFWVGVRAEGRELEPAAQACNDLPRWVDNGAAPPQNAITPEMLGRIAYGEINLPQTKVSLAPAGNTKVNLGTWAWLDKGVFNDKSVTATLNAGGVTISATATARPASVRLKPGTQDATLHPGSGECAFNPGGGAGVPFAAGSENQTPPCGITYLRSSGNGTFPLQASVTWNAGWTGSNGQRGGLPSGAMEGEPQNVTVQEIQAVNR